MHRRLILALPILLHAAPASASDAAACETLSTTAQRQRMSHALVAARASLLACAQPECPSIIRRDCERWLAEVDALMPTVVPAPRDAQGRDLVDVRVEVDGTPRAPRIDGIAMPIDPGPHVFRFVYEDRIFEETIVVREGEKGRLLTVTLTRPETAPSRPLVDPIKEPNNEQTPSRAAFYVTAGAGVAALATSGIFGLLGLSDYSRVQDSCGASRSCSSSDLSSTRTKFLVADVALGIGVISLATAAYLYWSATLRGR